VESLVSLGGLAATKFGFLAIVWAMGESADLQI